MIQWYGSRIFKISSSSPTILIFNPQIRTGLSYNFCLWQAFYQQFKLLQAGLFTVKLCPCPHRCAREFPTARVLGRFWGAQVNKWFKNNTLYIHWPRISLWWLLTDKLNNKRNSRIAVVRHRHWAQLRGAVNDSRVAAYRCIDRRAHLALLGGAGTSVGEWVGETNLSVGHGSIATATRRGARVAQVFAPFFSTSRFQTLSSSAVSPPRRPPSRAAFKCGGRERVRGGKWHKNSQTPLRCCCFFFFSFYNCLILALLLPSNFRREWEVGWGRVRGDGGGLMENIWSSFRQNRNFIVIKECLHKGRLLDSAGVPRRWCPPSDVELKENQVKLPPCCPLHLVMEHNASSPRNLVGLISILTLAMSSPISNGRFYSCCLHLVNISSVSLNYGTGKFFPLFILMMNPWAFSYCPRVRVLSVSFFPQEQNPAQTSMRDTCLKTKSINQ